MTNDSILTWVQAVLSTTPQRWEELIHTLPVDLITRSPAVGEWSALECLQHIIDTEAIFNTRLDSFQKGRDFAAFNPDSEGTRLADPSPAEMVAAFKHMREKSLQAIALLTPEMLSRRVRHAELGPVTLGEMIHEWAAHDFNHTIQAERAIMQPFLNGCGPWQVYFQEHLIR